MSNNNWKLSINEILNDEDFYNDLVKIMLLKLKSVNPYASIDDAKDIIHSRLEVLYNKPFNEKFSNGMNKKQYIKAYILKSSKKELMELIKNNMILRIELGESDDDTEENPHVVYEGRTIISNRDDFEIIETKMIYNLLCERINMVIENPQLFFKSLYLKAIGKKHLAEGLYRNLDEKIELFANLLDNDVEVAELWDLIKNDLSKIFME